MLLALTLLGCTAGQADVNRNGGPGAGLVPLTADAAPAFDPARSPLAWSVAGAPGAGIEIAVERDGQVLWTTSATLDGSGTLDGTWDAAAEPPEPGPLTLVVTAGSQTATDPTAAVRVGFDEAWFGDADGADRTRQVLFWRGGRTLQSLDQPVSVAVDGADFPAVSSDVVAAPVDGTAEPVAYPHDARPVVALGVPAGNGFEHATIEVVADGWTATTSPALEAGGVVKLQRDEPLGTTVGLTDETVALRFEAIDDDGSRHDLGTQLLPTRVYRLLGPQTTGFAADEAQPWVAAIDPALRAIDGTVAEHDAVIDALVAWVYNDLGLTYDTAAGASFYSEYAQGNWDEPIFFLSDFLQRRNGDTINCSDSGNILATHANMVGAELVHIVILQNYQLNEIKAVGQAQFTSCPFGPWGCSFSYHAVTTDSPDGATIWDTTLALDGDADPGNAPSTELLVQTLSGQEYLDRLVRSGSAAYDHPAQVIFE